jgi:aspartate aminotransferase
MGGKVITMVNQKCYELGSAPSVIRELFAYGLKKAAEVGPENVYDYSLGNPSIPAPPKVNESIHKLVDTEDPIKLHGYSMAAGFDEVREAVAANLRKRFGMDIKKENLFFTCGAAPAITAVCSALRVSHQSEIVAIAPYFPEYKVFVEGAGAKFKVVPPDRENFQVDIDELEKCITDQTQAVIVNSPNNPSGVVYSEDTILAIGKVLHKKAEEYGHPIYIIADEPYRELVYGGVKVPFIPTLYDNTIVCYSYSKSLSLPGERIGYVLVPDGCADSKEVYAAVAGAARKNGHVCPPTLIQRVIEHCADEMPNLKAYNENRELLYNSLKDMGYECAKPDGAFYLFVKAPNGDANAFSEKAKLDYNLLVVPGDGFGCSGYFRLAYCVDHSMIERSLPAFQKMIDAYK